MGKRGPQPKGNVACVWSGDFAYAIGLLVTDGSLSKDGRHIDFTSKEVAMIRNFLKGLGIQAYIGTKLSGKGNRYYRIQFSDVRFYDFLLDLGCMPNKTKVVADIAVPKKYFFDFLRGHFDGDGSFYSYRDPRWPTSFMYYLTFISASNKHIMWLREKLYAYLGVSGSLTKAKNTSCYQLRFAKQESLKVLRSMYPNKNVLCSKRKRLKIEKALGIVDELL